MVRGSPIARETQEIACHPGKSRVKKSRRSEAEVPGQTRELVSNPGVLRVRFAVLDIFRTQERFRAFRVPVLEERVDRVVEIDAERFHGRAELRVQHARPGGARTLGRWSGRWESHRYNCCQFRRKFVRSWAKCDPRANSSILYGERRRRQATHEFEFCMGIRALPEGIDHPLPGLHCCSRADTQECAAWLKKQLSSPPPV